MTARVIPNVGSHTVETLNGDEYISFRSGSQGDKQITAEKLRHYFGGDIAAPSIRLERGGASARISDLPNAEFSVQEGDVVTGIQNGANVNFSRAQLLAPLVEVMRDLVAEVVAEELAKNK